MNRVEIDRKAQDIVLFRGTIEDVKNKFNDLKINRDEDVVFQKFEEETPTGDIGFNTNVGQIGDEYIDYEVYLLPTKKTNHYIVTEVNPF
jgi:hypothetical protein